MHGVLREVVFYFLPIPRCQSKAGVGKCSGSMGLEQVTGPVPRGHICPRQGLGAWAWPLLGRLKGRQVHPSFQMRKQ